MPCLRIVVPLLVAMIGFGIAYANAKDPPPEVDAARQNERYAIKPGTESLLGDMLGRGESLAGNCTLSDGKIARTSVLATYTCGEAHVVLQLVHPASAPSGGVRTERFAISVQSGTPPEGFVEAVAAKIRAREAGFEWLEVGEANASGERAAAQRRSVLTLAAGAVAATVAVWMLRRRARSRTTA